MRIDTDRATDNGKATTSNPVANIFPVSDGLAEVNQSAAHLAGLLVRATPGIDSVTVPENNLSRVAKQIALQLRGLGQFIDALNQLPPSSIERSPNVGAFLLPFSVQGLSSKAPPHGPSRLLLDSYERTHPDPASDSFRISYPPSLGAIPHFLTAEPDNHDLPPSESYIKHSLDDSLRSQCARFLDGRTKAQQDLNELEATVNARQQQPKFEDPLAGPIEKARGEINTFTRNIDNLFDQKLKDVRPEQVPECIAGVGAKVAPCAAVISNTLKLHAELEKLIVGILSPQKTDEPLALSLPALGSGGNIVFAETQLGNEFRSEAAVDAGILTNIIQAYSESRRTLLSIYRSIDSFPALRSFQSSLEYALQAPLKAYGADGHSAQKALFTHDDVGLSQALTDLLGQPYLHSEKHKVEANILEDTTTIAPLLWTIRNFLSGDSMIQIEAHDLLHGSALLVKEVLPFLTRIKECLDNDDLVNLTQILTERIEKVATSKNLFEGLSPILALATLTQDRRIVQKLKNQIPNTDSLLLRVDELTNDHTGFSGELHTIVANTISRLSATLSDYYRQPEMIEFWDYLDRFQAYREDPSCIQGLAGNEAMSGGILLKGVPGVGKSYLVECVAREYGLKCFSTSPDKGVNGSGDDLLLSAAKEAFSQAINHVTNEKTPCILFIDEAETMVPDRKSPQTSLPESSLTGYILREINEIRRKFPEIIVIIASNYPEDLDPALLRIGRIDIQVEMTPPGPDLRAVIIEDTLEKSPSKFPMTPEQMDEAVAMTDGFIPLQLVQCINELTRIDPIVAKKRGDPFSLNFEALKGKFKRESERRSSYQSEIQMRKEKQEVVH